MEPTIEAHLPAQDQGLRLRDPWFTCFQANDLAKEALDVLLDDSGPQHVFNGLLETLPADYRQRIVNMRPPKKANKDVATKCYEAQGKFIAASCAELFKEQSACCCLKHPGQNCPLYFPGIPDEAGPQPLKANFSGPMCTPWTPQGQKNGMADESIESYNVWSNKMEVSPLDLVFMENSDQFPWTLFKEVMERAGRWQCFHVVFGAEDRVM